MNKILILSHADLPGALRHKTIESVSIHDFNDTDIPVIPVKIEVVVW